MNRNQKIALGCGIAGCLGLILIVIVIVLLGVLGYIAMPGSSNRNENFNSTRNSNSNSNDNTNSSSDSNSNSESSSPSSSTMSDDDKHKLYQAAGMTGDAELIRRVSIKIGLMDEDYTPGENYQSFVAEHVDWALKNTGFINSINTPEKARAYINAHMD